jgi:hypothetical protein
MPMRVLAGLVLTVAVAAATIDQAAPATAQQQVDEHGLYSFADAGSGTALFSWMTSGM